MATYFTTPSGSTCARVRRRGHPPVSQTFPTAALAKAWAKGLEAEIDSGRAGVLPAKLTVGELVARYKREFQRTKPFGKNKLAVLGYFDHHLGRERLSALSTQRLVRYITEDRRVHGVTANIDLSYLGTMFKSARLMWGLPIPSSLVNDARELLKHGGMVTRSMERDRRPTADEIERLRGWLRLHSRSLTPDILDFIIDSCFRPPSEIVRLRWADLNEKDRTIVIRDRKHPRKKLGNHQTVPLLGRCFDIVQRQPRVSEFIFPVNGKSWSSIFPRACRELGIKDLWLYDFRHHAISLLVESGRYSIPEVMLCSGHSDPRMMMRYTHLRAKDLHR